VGSSKELPLVVRSSDNGSDIIEEQASGTIIQSLGNVFNQVHNTISCPFGIVAREPAKLFAAGIEIGDIGL
jgi:hypothetical protein